MTPETVMSCMQTSHVTKVSVWRHTHINETRGTHVSKSSDTCEWVTWHRWMSHVSHVNVSSLTHVTFVGTVLTPHKEHCITNTNTEWLQRVGFVTCLWIKSQTQWGSFSKRAYPFKEPTNNYNPDKVPKEGLSCKIVSHRQTLYNAYLQKETWKIT